MWQILVLLPLFANANISMFDNQGFFLPLTLCPFKNSGAEKEAKSCLPPPPNFYGSSPLQGQNGVIHSKLGGAWGIAVARKTSRNEKILLLAQVIAFSKSKNTYNSTKVHDLRLHRDLPKINFKISS